MDLFRQDLVVTKIALALFLPRKMGKPIHRDRPFHGLALNLNYGAVYRFDTGEELYCHGGELIYLPKGSNYTVELFDEGTEGSGVYAINFLTLPESEGNRPCILKCRGLDKLYSLFSKAATSWRKQEIGYYEECMACLYSILRVLKKETAEYTPVGKALSVLQPALAYIDEHYKEESISSSHLASLCGVSEPYLRRLFQKAFATSPALFTKELRLKHAKELLSTGEYTVTEAATLSGFNDTAYFSREFKKSTGLAPREYK